MIPRSLANRFALTVVTDPSCGEGRTIVSVVRAALNGGAPAIQLRWKMGSAREMVDLGRRLLVETRSTGALFIVNDRVDVALAIDADGAHLGAHDLPISAARRICPSGFLLGRSADSVDEALHAQTDGADYVGLGPIVATPSKSDAAAPIGIEGIRAARSAVTIPIVAIGGVNQLNTAEIVAAGADGVAVIRAVVQAPDPEDASRALLREVDSGIKAR